MSSKISPGSHSASRSQIRPWGPTFELFRSEDGLHLRLAPKTHRLPLLWKLESAEPSEVTAANGVTDSDSGELIASLGVIDLFGVVLRDLAEAAEAVSCRRPGKLMGSTSNPAAASTLGTA